jgi:hypothetical protein
MVKELFVALLNQETEYLLLKDISNFDQGLINVQIRQIRDILYEDHQLPKSVGPSHHLPQVGLVIALEVLLQLN